MEMIFWHGRCSVVLILLKVDFVRKVQVNLKGVHPEHTATGQNFNLEMNAQTVPRECFARTMV